MCITTKSRYGLRFLVYLAKNKERKVSLREFSKEENLPVKYLEQIVRPLINANIVRGERGRFGGFVLSNSPENISVFDVVKAVDGHLFDIPCYPEPSGCEESEECELKDIWVNLIKTGEKYLSKVSLSSIAKRRKKK